MSDEDLGAIAAVEACLFVAGVPVGVGDLAEAIGLSEEAVVAALQGLATRCQAADRGVELVQVAGKWQLRTRATYAAAVLKLRGGRPVKLSRPALEVLAVIAYRQPVTRLEVENLRGVDSGGVLKTLLERDLVRVVGRRDEPGRPLEYGTTPGFLELFGLPAIGALPTLREREELGILEGGRPDEET